MTHLKTLLATATVMLLCSLSAHSEELLSVRATVCDPPEDVVYLYQKLMADGAIIKIPGNCREMYGMINPRYASPPNKELQFFRKSFNNDFQTPVQIHGLCLRTADEPTKCYWTVPRFVYMKCNGEWINEPC
jgi:hypothetical protein